MRTNKRQFTLIELLVVISIIALLASMLLPALSQARVKAKTAACQSNRKQLYLALAMYCDDFEGRVPNQGMPLGGTTGYTALVWGDARYHSEQELQNAENNATWKNMPGRSPDRYYGIGKLWPGGYLHNGESLYCTDLDSTRIRNASTITGSRLAYRAAGSSNSFVMDDGTYRLNAAAWGRFHPTTLFVGAWYLSETIGNSMVTGKSNKVSFGKACILEQRNPAMALVVDRVFEAGGEWEATIPHQNTGVVRVASDGRVAFMRNPWAGNRVHAVPYGNWTPAGHPWSLNYGGTEAYSRHTIDVLN